MTRTILVVALLAATPAAAQVATRPAPAGLSVDSLAAVGRLQEAAWAARAVGDTARGEALLVRLDSILRSPPLEAEPMDMEKQGVSYTFRLRHGGGVEALFKVDGSDIFCASCGASREVAVYRIDRLLGLDLTPVTVFQAIEEDGRPRKGSSMYFMGDVRSPAELGLTKPDRLRFLDAVVGNSDRHSGNWLVREDGSVVAIDHNRAFDYRPTTRPKTCWESQIDSIAGPASLGPAYERYRSLPADSLHAAVAGILEPELATMFVAMRDRVVDRIQRRARNPARRLPREDCPWQE